MTSTLVKTYHSDRAMRSDIKRMERKGWSVSSVQRVGQGWGVAKTAVLGLVFLPLALLGKKRDIIQVVYRREARAKRSPLGRLI